MFRVRPMWAALACVLPLHAIPGNSISNDLGDSVDTWAYVLANAPLAQSFTTGSTGYMLTNVSVELSSDPNSVPTARPKRRASENMPPRPAGGVGLQQEVTVTLWSDNGVAFPGNGPGVLLATSTTTLLGASLTFPAQVFNFPITSQLTANTHYWIEVISPNADSTAAWWGTNNPAGTDIATEYTIIGNSGPVSITDPFAFLINVVGLATPPGSPAPSSLILAMIGLACGGLYVVRRRFFEIVGDTFRFYTSIM